MVGKPDRANRRSTSPPLVENVGDLRESVRRFWAAPDLWKDAVRTHPKYFVHLEEAGESYFGLSKFCALKGISLREYVGGYRHRLDGKTARVHISRITRQAWQPLAEVSPDLRERFTEWWESAPFPRGYDLGQVSIITLPADERSQASGSDSPRIAGRSYWAFHVDPDRYRIQEALRNVRTDLWATGRSRVRAGDRVAFWQTLGKGGSERGIVAFGEVMSDRELLDDRNSPYWVNPADGNARKMRVWVRYVQAPKGPLWDGGPASDILRQLTAYRGEGPVFHISPEQWEALMRAAGGWPADSSEVEELREAVEAAAGKGTGQGYRVDPEVRRAVEKRAMVVAREHFEKRWKVKDVSSNHPYDLDCRNLETGAELRVEVKGTTSNGAKVILTPNEVRNARDHKENVALCIVANIQVARGRDGKVNATGGTLRVYKPWEIDKGNLMPMGFEYEPPPPSS